MVWCFFLNDPATTDIYTYGHTLSLHDALPIYDGSRADVDFIDDGLKMAGTWLPKGRTEILHAQRTGEEFRGDQSRAVVAGGSIAFTQRGKIRVCHRTPEES